VGPRARSTSPSSTMEIEDLQAERVGPRGLVLVPAFILQNVPKAAAGPGASTVEFSAAPNEPLRLFFPLRGAFNNSESCAPTPEPRRRPLQVTGIREGAPPCPTVCPRPRSAARLRHLPVASEPRARLALREPASYQAQRAPRFTQNRRTRPAGLRPP